jgi:hypothetical protein
MLVLGVAMLQPAFAFRADPVKAPCTTHVVDHAAQGGHADPGPAIDRDTADLHAACAGVHCAAPGCGGLCLALPMNAAPPVTGLVGRAPATATQRGELGDGAAPEVPPPIA